MTTVVFKLKQGYWQINGNVVYLPSTSQNLAERKELLIFNLFKTISYFVLGGLYDQPHIIMLPGFGGFFIGDINKITCRTTVEFAMITALKVIETLCGACRSRMKWLSDLTYILRSYCE
ncbi:hypothetical protein VU677_15080 [Hafnia paralvei]|uniref:hypothetical protein n=1 Tax=Hafnia paralvei TaxID=546367 RepID=UPI00300D4FB2